MSTGYTNIKQANIGNGQFGQSQITATRGTVSAATLAGDEVITAVRNASGATAAGYIIGADDGEARLYLGKTSSAGAATLRYVGNTGAVTLSGPDEITINPATSLTVSTAASFGGAVTATPTSNQIVLGTTNTATISASAPAASRVYTIADPGTDANFVMTEGAQTINGAKTFTNLTLGSVNTTGVITSTAASNQLVLGSSTFTAPGGTARTYTISDPGTDASFVLTEGAQTINGAKTFSGALTVSAASNQIVISGVNKTLNFLGAGVGTLTFPNFTGADTVATLGTTQTVTGVKTFSSVANFTATPAIRIQANSNISATADGLGTKVVSIPATGNTNCDFVVTVSAQTIGGVKTFTSTPVAPSYTATATTNQLLLGTTNTATISATAPAASRVYTIADPGANASFVMTAGAQTIGGVKTFTSAPVAPSYTATATTNQLLLGTTNTATISATAPAASRVYTIADPGANANFVMTEGAQTINGAKTFTNLTLSSVSTAGTITSTAGSNQLVLGNTTFSAAGGTSRTISVLDPGANSNMVLATNTAATGQYLIATSSTAATWQTVDFGLPTAAANADGGGVNGATFTLYFSDATNPGINSVAAQTYAGLKTFNNGIRFTSPGTPITLNVSERSFFSPVNLIGINNGNTYATTLSLDVCQVGKLLTINITANSSATNFNSAGLYLYYDLPTRYAPSPFDQTALCIVGNGATPAVSTVELAATGRLRFYANLAKTAVFTNSASSRIYACTFSFIVA